MKKLIFKKFIYEWLIFFVVSLFFMGLIVWTLQAVNYFDFVSEDGHGLKIYFAYTFLNFPKIIHRIFPFMLFISLFYTLIRYEKNDELNIFWINGISKIKFINYIILFSIFLMIFQIFLGSYLSPSSQLKARNLIKNSNIDFFTNLINDGKFINAVKGLTIFIDQKNSENFTNIFIDDSTKNITRLIYAQNGILASDGKEKKFILFNGEVINIDKNRLNIFEFDQIDFNLENFGSNSIIQPKIQEINSISLLNCILGKKISIKTACQTDSLYETKQELLKRYFKPLYIPLITMLCSLLIISGKYNPNFKKISIYIFLIVLIAIFISEASLRYSATSITTMILFLLIPILMFCFTYIFTYLKFKDA